MEIKRFNIDMRVHVRSVDAVDAETARKTVEAWFDRVADLGFGLPGFALPCAIVTTVEEAR